MPVVQLLEHPVTQHFSMFIFEPGQRQYHTQECSNPSTEMQARPHIQGVARCMHIAGSIGHHEEACFPRVGLGYCM